MPRARASAPPITAASTTLTFQAPPVGITATARRVAALLAGDSGMRRAPIEAGEVGGLHEILTAEGELRTLPCHLPHADPRLAGLDGFYAARLVKS